MHLLVDEPIAAHHRNGEIVIRFKSGRQLSFLVQGNPRLENAAEKDLGEIELSPFGIHWPKLDEDLSFEGIMRGDYGQREGKG